MLDIAFVDDSIDGQMYWSYTWLRESDMIACSALSKQEQWQIEAFESASAIPGILSDNSLDSP